MKAMGEQTGQSVQVVPMNGHECVWMKIGMINLRTCENGFDCTSCNFDKAMSKRLVEESINWRDVMRQSHLHKECRHMLTGRVVFNLCSHNYECKDCAYDQQLYEYELLQQ